MEKSIESADIVIVNYNAGAMLAECVRAALASSVPTRVYVSDNASHDDSIEYLWSVIAPENRLTVVKNQRNLGFARANNVVLSQCRSEYVLFLNPDCVIRPDTIERMIDVMRAHPEAGVAGCLILNPDGSEQPTCRRYIPTPWRTFVRMFRLYRLFPNHVLFQPWSLSGLPLPQTPVEVEALSGAFMFVRRTAMERVGYLDEAYFLHCEDLDWFMRFRRAGWKVLFVPHVTVVHWKGFSSKAHPVKVEYHKHRGMVHFYNKFFRERYPGVVMVVVMIAIWARFVAKASWLLLRSPVSLSRSPRKPASPPFNVAGTSDAEVTAERDARPGALREASANPDRP